MESMHSFPVIAIQSVSHGSFFTLFYRKTTLPFAPTLGMELELTTTKGYWRSDLVRVIFVEAIGTFICDGTDMEIKKPETLDLERAQEWDIHAEKRKTFNWLVSDGWVQTPKSFEWAAL